MSRAVSRAMRYMPMESETDGKRGPLLLALNPFSPVNYITAVILTVLYFSLFKNAMNSLSIEFHVIIMILAYLVIQVTVMTLFCKFVAPLLAKIPVMGVIFSFICSI